MKRILLLVSVAALIAVMLVVGASAAFAAPRRVCPGPFAVATVEPGTDGDTNVNGLICVKETPQKLLVKDDLA